MNVFVCIVCQIHARDSPSLDVNKRKNYLRFDDDDDDDEERMTTTMMMMTTTTTTTTTTTMMHVIGLQS